MPMLSFVMSGDKKEFFSIANHINKVCIGKAVPIRREEVFFFNKRIIDNSSG
jgi:hypothetical protein